MKKRSIPIGAVVLGIIAVVAFLSTPHSAIKQHLSVPKAHYHISSGDAELTHNLTEDNQRFLIGSITKMITASLVFIMEDRGLLSLDDLVVDYIDWYPIDEDVTIADLLRHTSGIHDGSHEDVFYPAFFNQTETVTTEVLLSFSTFDNARFTHYANSNYWLLGMILEQVTGQSYEALMYTEIFGPLGLDDACIPVFDEACDVVRGYVRLPDGTVFQFDHYDAFISIAGSAGNVAMSAPDLERFMQALMADELFPFERMFCAPSFEQYQCGIQSYGDGWYGHDGQTLDSASLALMNSDTGDTVTLLIADAGADVWAIVESLQ